MYGRATALKRIPNAELALAPLGGAMSRVMPLHSHAMNDAEYFPDRGRLTGIVKTQDNSNVASYAINTLGQRVKKTLYQAAGIQPGDADGNGAINANDFAVATDAIAGKAVAPGNADCNQDARLTVVDLVCINNLLKNGNTRTSVYLYDEAGHLRGEYDAFGSAVREYVWFDGKPVAMLAGGRTYSIYSDHLNTPRAVVNQNNALVWSWDGAEAFGNSAPNEDPDNDKVRMVFNLRFAGQYFDIESGLHYNYFRTYDPKTGRYLESDPVGLKGGLNTYSYVYNNPLRWTDPTGLEVLICRRPADIAAGLVDHNWVRTDTMSAGLGGNPNVRPGDAYEAPYITQTYVTDHSKDKPSSCEKMNNVDEPCVNSILSNELGISQGRFGPYMNCQAYAYSVVNRCRTGPQIPPSSPAR